MTDQFENRRKCIIDCDGGVDDCEALMLALSPHFNNASNDSTQLEVLGITCAAGNTSLDNVVGNVLRMLKICNREDIPVYRGAESPLLPQDGQESASHIHGSDGFAGLAGTIPVDTGLVKEELAPSALIRLVKSHPNQSITLITLGPLTNVAIAYRLWAGLGSQLDQLIIMGGDAGGKGNMQELVTAEFNFGYDPEAASIVLKHFGCPVTIVPFDTCMKSWLSWEWRTQWLSANSIKANLIQRLQAVINANRTKGGVADPEGFYTCDLYAMAVFLDPAMIKVKETSCVLVETGNSPLTRGQMVMDRRRVFKSNLTASVVLELDTDRLKALMMKMF